MHDEPGSRSRAIAPLSSLPSARPGHIGTLSPPPATGHGRRGAPERGKATAAGVPAGSFWGFRGGKPALEMSTTLKGSGKLLVARMRKMSELTRRKTWRARRCNERQEEDLKTW